MASALSCISGLGWPTIEQVNNRSIGGGRVLAFWAVFRLIPLSAECAAGSRTKKMTSQTSVLLADPTMCLLKGTHLGVVLYFFS